MSKVKLTNDNYHPISIHIGGIWHFITIDEAIVIADDIQKTIIEIGNKEIVKIQDVAKND